MKKNRFLALALSLLMALALPLGAFAEENEPDTLLEGLVTEVLEQGFVMEDIELGSVLLNVDETTVMDGILAEGDIEVGQYVFVEYDGRLTRSLPPQAHADRVGCYRLTGTVDLSLSMGVLLTGDPLTSETVTALQDQLAAVGEDVDGDGKVEVLIENLALGIAYSNQKIANDNTFMAHLASGDVLLFAAEPAYYDKKIASLSEDGSSFFAPLSNGDTYVRWHPGRQDVSEELYIGVRPATGTAKQNQSYEQCRRLLEQLMAQN